MMLGLFAIIWPNSLNFGIPRCLIMFEEIVLDIRSLRPRFDSGFPRILLSYHFDIVFLVSYTISNMSHKFQVPSSVRLQLTYMGTYVGCQKFGKHVLSLLQRNIYLIFHLLFTLFHSLFHLHFVFHFIFFYYQKKQLCSKYQNFG